MKKGFKNKNHTLYSVIKVFNPLAKVYDQATDHAVSSFLDGVAL
jgi:hypothetical protein